MSELHGLLAETVERALTEAAGQTFEAAWRIVEDAGLVGILIPEEAGGFGGGMEEALIATTAAGRHSIPLPLAEAIAAAAVLNDAGLPLPKGPFALVELDGELSGGRFSGRSRRAPWGRFLSQVVGVLPGGAVVLVDCDGAEVEEGANIAGEPRDTLSFSAASAQSAQAERWSPERVRLLLALGLASQMAGALKASLALAVPYVQGRKQFGRPLSALQAIQQQIAVLAEEVAAAEMAAAAAARAWDDGVTPTAATAKLRANMAADLGVGIAHQVHGAMGFTVEYPLHGLTLRLMAWRGEYGDARDWSLWLGRRMAGLGADRLWPEIVAPGQSD